MEFTSGLLGKDNQRPRSGPYPPAIDHLTGVVLEQVRSDSDSRRIRLVMKNNFMS
jgi:hypothetical protein